MVKSIKHFTSLLLFILTISLANSQNQKTIDSLLTISNATIENKQKVDIYLEIASLYERTDSINTYTYSNKATELASGIGYTEGRIDALFSIGVINLYKGNFEISKSIFSKMEQLSKENNYTKGYATALYGLGWLNTYSGKNDIGLEYLIESMTIREEQNEKKLLAKNYSLIGIIFMKKANYDKALYYFFKSLKINEDLDNESNLAGNYTNIGILYKNRGNTTKAIEYYSKSLAISKRLNMKGVTASNYTNLGILYDIQKDYKKSLEHQFEALDIRKEIGNKRGIAYNYDNIAITYMKMELYDESLLYFSNALEILNEINSYSDKALPLIYIGTIYRELNQLKKAKHYLKDGINLAQEAGLIKKIRDGARQLALVEQQLGNYKKAYQAHVLFKSMTDSLNNTESIQKITRLETEYEFQKEKDSLQLVQKQEKTLLKIEKEKQQDQRLIVYIIIGLVLILCIGSYIAKNKMSERKKLRSLRNRISKDLHDDIGSTLTSISLYSTVATNLIKEDPKKAEQLLSKINTNAIMTTESINDIVWTIKSENDTLINLINRMRSYASELQETGEWTIEISHNSSARNTVLNMIQRRNMYLIFKEALNNAIKYSKGNQISVALQAVKNTIIMTIVDNEIGFNPNDHSHDNTSFGGNGLNNMKIRAGELDGKLEIFTNTDNKGTHIQLTFSI